MRCPSCNFEDTQVKDSRQLEDGSTIKRRRFCTKCDKRFTTFERVQLRDITVVKKDGSRAPFNREKILHSIMISARKRPIPQKEIDNIVGEIAREIEDFDKSEIATEEIGKLVMEKLLELDHVAYVRFASVYRDFREAKDFKKFIKDIGK